MEDTQVAAILQALAETQQAAKANTEVIVGSVEEARDACLELARAVLQLDTSMKQLLEVSGKILDAAEPKKGEKNPFEAIETKLDDIKNGVDGMDTTVREAFIGVIEDASKVPEHA